nr:MarR family winged helix-turn-helix transcriptional regulator [Brevundimonas diminuta]
MKLERPEQLRSEPPLDELLRRLIAADHALSPAHGRSGLGALAALLAKERRARDAFFDPSLFGEPAWDILLALRTGADRHCPALSALPIRSPTSTAHRHVLKLQNAGLVDVWPDISDMRRRKVGLTPEGAKAMQAYLAEIALTRALPQPP